jgi:hypothetical protein
MPVEVPWEFRAMGNFATLMPSLGRLMTRSIVKSSCETNLADPTLVAETRTAATR